MKFFNQRKIYFIKKDFQSRFILRFVVIATAWAAATVLLFAYLAKERLDTIRYSSYVDIKTTGDLLLPITVGAHIVSLFIFTGLLVYTIHSLWKNLSSPLKKIKTNISLIASGDLANNITLDSHEEFQDLAADLEGMRNALRVRFIRIKEHQEEMSLAASELDRSIHEGISPASPAMFLRDAVERMKADIDAFRC
jgi:methyl-accepting chemotaxis protein